jgi:hypothetical protein
MAIGSWPDPGGFGADTALGSGSARTTRSGEATVSSALIGPAHLQAAHPANATTAGGGPIPVTLASALVSRSAAGSTSSSTTQPPTRRPLSEIRTRVPTPTSASQPGGTS